MPKKRLIYLTGAQAVGKSTLCKSSGWHEIEIKSYAVERADLAETIDFQFLGYDTIAVTSQEYSDSLNRFLFEQAVIHKALYNRMKLKTVY